jgi:hypothetical protein
VAVALALQDRVNKYVKKVKKAQDEASTPSQPRMRLDKDAANRLMSRASGDGSNASHEDKQQQQQQNNGNEELMSERGEENTGKKQQRHFGTDPMTEHLNLMREQHEQEGEESSKPSGKKQKRRNM